MINRLRDERGFSMVVVMLVMMVSGMFVVAAFAAANGDLPLSRKSQDRKVAYAAAEAGLNFYMFHVTAENDYWTKCTNVPAPNASEPSPVNQAWNGTGSDPRTWRTIPGSTAKYTVELLPATGYTQCQQGNGSSMLDPRTGMFRIRATGVANGVKRSIIGTFRRSSFLDYVYFTDYETLPPAANSNPTWAAANCVQYRAGRPSGCGNIQFAAADVIYGPLHTNDDIQVCDAATFGRTASDRIEISGPSPGYDKVCSSTEPNFVGSFKPEVAMMTMPTTNGSLETNAASAYKYTGRTAIRLKGDVMDVWKSDGTTQTNVPFPANGVIYVSNGAGGCPSTSPEVADYAEGSGCGNVYVSGSYSKSLTIGSQNDVVVAPPPPGGVWPGAPSSSTVGSNDADIVKNGDAVLGLIANNFIRVAHRVNRGSSSCSNLNSTPYPNIGNVQIDAAILSVNGSFIVDNWSCGNKEGTLTVNGAIAQRFRGPVGTGGGSGTGYLKDYKYDDRLKYRSPPFFLEPVSAAWNLVRTNEQAPAR